MKTISKDKFNSKDDKYLEFLIKSYLESLLDCLNILFEQLSKKKIIVIVNYYCKTKKLPKDHYTTLVLSVQFECLIKGIVTEGV